MKNYATRIDENRKVWLSDKTPEYVHGWRECEKGNAHKQYMYPEQHEQDEYTRGYGEFFAVHECEAN